MANGAGSNLGFESNAYVLDKEVSQMNRRNNS
jgi:hypothetical protein